MTLKMEKGNYKQRNEDAPISHVSKGNRLFSVASIKEQSPDMAFVLA